MNRKVLWAAATAALLIGVGVSVAVWAPYHQPPPQVVTIRLGNFYFEGPLGRSDSADEPKVVVRLKNGQRYKLVFENTTGTPHQVISPLFAAPEEKVYPVSGYGRVEIEITPKFRTVEDGYPLLFDLSCHVGHGSSFDHFKQGMHALIEVVP